eukprot:scaffold60269_cov51-Attheya_sp.AAC.10
MAEDEGAAIESPPHDDGHSQGDSVENEESCHNLKKGSGDLNDHGGDLQASLLVPTTGDGCNVTLPKHFLGPIDRGDKTENFSRLRVEEFSNEEREIHSAGVNRKNKPMDASQLLRIKELGKRTRERFSEERNKRKEIVRIDAPATTGEKNEPPKRKRLKIAASGTKRNRAIANSPRVLKRKVGGVKDSSLDRWMPNVSHCLMFTKNERSSVVRLHGLPEGVRPEQIKKFFSGLHVERIGVILPQIDTTHIPWFDPLPHVSNVHSSTKDSTQVPRHDDKTFRVLVKFESLAIAELAKDRSGEVINVEIDGKIQNATIAVTPVAKSMGNFLLNNMVIDGVKGQALSKTHSDSMRTLSPIVPNILAVMFRKRIIGENSVLTSPREGCKSCLAEGDEEDDGILDGIPMDANQYERLIKYINFLRNELEDLEMRTIPFGIYRYDPSLQENAVSCLSNVASNWLLCEIDQIHLLLRQFRLQNKNKNLKV